MDGASASLRSTSVRRVGSEVVKAGYEDLPMELEKCRALHNISVQNGFVSPKVVSSSPGEASISFEYLPGLSSIREAYLGACRGRIEAGSTRDLFRRVGLVLQQIHSKLRLSTVVEWRASAEFESELRREKAWNNDFMNRMPAVVLHGDYGFANVFSREGETDLVVLDPSPNGFTTFFPNEVGPGLVDVANMLACIQGLVSPLKYPLIDWRIADSLAEAFLRGYEEASALQLPRPLTFAFARATARTYLNYRSAASWQRLLAQFLFFLPLKSRLLYRD